MGTKADLQSVEGVGIHCLIHYADGTVLGAVRVQQDVPAAVAKLHEQGWTIARSADEAPDVANMLGMDFVPTDVLLIECDTGDQLIDSVH